MKLRICNHCVPPKERRFFAEAFPLLTKRLGISEYQSTVELHYDDNGGTTNGSIEPAPTDSVLASIRAGKCPREFDIKLRPQSLDRMLVSFCHEMVHLKQWVTGELKATADGNYPKQIYHNVQVTDLDIPYEQRPWEMEAFAKMEPLATWVAGEMMKQREKANG